MRRRDFIKVIAGSATAWPLVARAQQGDQKRRVGILMPYAKGDAENEALVAAFKQELAKLGWGRRPQRPVRRALDHGQYGRGTS